MQGKKIKADIAGGKENRRCFTWQASSLYSANFSSLASVSPLLMKASASSSMALSRPQSSSQRLHSCKSRHRRHFFPFLRIARVRISANAKFENRDFSILTPPPPFQRGLHFSLLSMHGLRTRSRTNLDPPLRGHFLLQRPVLQSPGSGLQPQPLISVTPQRFRPAPEQALHKGQLRLQDPQELLDWRETRGAVEKWENRREKFKKKSVGLFGGKFWTLKQRHTNNGPNTGPLAV